MSWRSYLYQVYIVALLLLAVWILVGFESTAGAQTATPPAQQLSATPTITPSATPLPSPTATPSIDQRLTSLEQQIDDISDQLETPGKDVWDIINALSGLISGGIIAAIGIYVTHQYNKRQYESQEIQKKKELEVLQVQTIQSFMPQLQSGDQKSVEAALLAITALGNPKLATELASLYRTEGALAALSKIASSPNRETAEQAEKSLSLIIQSLIDGVVNIYDEKDRAIGLGFIADVNGYVAIPEYMIESGATQGENIIIKYKENSYKPSIILAHSELGVAILKIEGAIFSSIPLQKEFEAQFLDEVFIVGYDKILGQTIAAGQITNTSSIIKTYPKQTLINVQIKASQVQHGWGYGGAPVVNRRGQVIGIGVLARVNEQKTVDSLLVIPSTVIIEAIEKTKQQVS